MNRKERFILFVFLGAIARDLSRGTGDAHYIALQADLIAADRIPPNPWNAAKVYLAFVDGRAKPHRWMLQS
jgi:hypothetical protein